MTDLPQNSPAARQGRSCASCLFGLVMSACFLLLGAFFAAPVVYLEAPAPYAMACGFLFVALFLWQLRASRTSCLVPPVLLAALFVSESLVLGTMVLHTGIYEQLDTPKTRAFMEKHAPGLHGSVLGFCRDMAARGKQLVDSGRDWARSALDADGTRIAALEEAFRNNPGSPDVVLALADAYMAKGDLASIRLATALYEALAETAPCDTFLARLADAYARALRYDLAFATAARRTWLPTGGCGKAARQIAYFAACCGDLNRGIFELERLLNLDPAEPEEVQLLLAGLYTDVGNASQARLLLDKLIAETPGVLATAKTARQMRQELGN
ncbi:MAG TPA: hypothetical protein PLP29_00225 [Candidatus Ozemobacteraceae bacterium]|nr:hypothetical protein [Candidatus Ozemobacteraceae bacterium]